MTDSTSGKKTLMAALSGKKYGWQHILEKNIIGIKCNGKL
jgi:hypothetical protein